MFTELRSRRSLRYQTVTVQRLDHFRSAEDGAETGFLVVTGSIVLPIIGRFFFAGLPLVTPSSIPYRSCRIRP